MTNLVSTFLFGNIEKAIDFLYKFLLGNLVTTLVHIDAKARLDSQPRGEGLYRRIFDNYSKTIGKSNALLQRCVGQDKGEFFSAIATGNIQSTNGLADQIGNVAQYDIPDLMTMDIIDGFKMIQVQHNQAGGLTGTAGTFHFQAQRQVKSSES